MSAQVTVWIFCFDMENFSELLVFSERPSFNDIEKLIKQNVALAFEEKEEDYEGKQEEKNIKKRFRKKKF